MGMLFSQPAYRSSCPLAIKSFCALNIRSLVKSAVTGKNAAGHKHGGHMTKCVKLIWYKMDSVTKESAIDTLGDRRKIGHISVQEIRLCSWICFPHCSIGETQCFR